jgi:hypothetical protein
LADFGSHSSKATTSALKALKAGKRSEAKTGEPPHRKGKRRRPQQDPASSSKESRSLKAAVSEPRVKIDHPSARTSFVRSDISASKLSARQRGVTGEPPHRKDKRRRPQQDPASSSEESEPSSEDDDAPAVHSPSESQDHELGIIMTGTFLENYSSREHGHKFRVDMDLTFAEPPSDDDSGMDPDRSGDGGMGHEEWSHMLGLGTLTNCDHEGHLDDLCAMYEDMCYRDSESSSSSPSCHSEYLSDY